MGWLNGINKNELDVCHLSHEHHPMVEGGRLHAYQLISPKRYASSTLPTSSACRASAYRNREKVESSSGRPVVRGQNPHSNPSMGFNARKAWTRDPHLANFRRLVRRISRQNRKSLFRRFSSGAGFRPSTVPLNPNQK